MSLLCEVDHAKESISPLGQSLQFSGWVDREEHVLLRGLCLLLRATGQRPKTYDEVCVLFSTYLDMLVENECEDEERAMTESMTELMQVPQVYEFVWRLYLAMYPYLAPILQKAEWYIYTMEHLQIINNNLFVQLDLDGDEEPLCLHPSLPPLNSSI